LDNDGDLDIVLGGNDGADTLLWNEGNLTFRWNGFGTGRTRTVNIVDVDGDGWQDIVLTKQTGALDYWRNLGSTVALDTVWSNQQFTRETLPGIAQPATAIDWADLDNDGDLDLVTGGVYGKFVTERSQWHLCLYQSSRSLYTNGTGDHNASLGAYSLRHQ